jgi:hypothetical protein
MYNKIFKIGRLIGFIPLTLFLLAIIFQNEVYMFISFIMGVLSILIGNLLLKIYTYEIIKIKHSFTDIKFLVDKQYENIKISIRYSVKSNPLTIAEAIVKLVINNADKKEKLLKFELNNDIGYGTRSIYKIASESQIISLDKGEYTINLEVDKINDDRFKIIEIVIEGLV